MEVVMESVMVVATATYKKTRQSELSLKIGELYSQVENV
jgi:hypothetical protein